MLPYIIRRLLWLPVLLSIMVFITFVLGFYGPGGPEVVLLGQRYDPETAARIREEWGFNDPLLVQYFRYLYNYANLNFGESLVKYQGQPISELVARRLPITLQLNLAAFLIGIPAGITLGMVAAFFRGGLVDRGIIVSTLFIGSVPILVLGPILLFIFARQLRILPAGGWDGLFSASAILPVALLSLGYFGGYARITRASVLEVLSADYVRTARAKGLSEKLLMTRHVLRNAFIPLVTFLGFAIGGLVEGTLMTELIFGIPGMGQFAFEAISSRDYPIVIALVVMGALVFAMANLVADLLYGVVDPRIRHT